MPEALHWQPKQAAAPLGSLPRDARRRVEVINAASPLKAMFGNIGRLRAQRSGRESFAMQLERYELAPAARRPPSRSTEAARSRRGSHRGGFGCSMILCELDASLDLGSGLVKGLHRFDAVAALVGGRLLQARASFLQRGQRRLHVLLRRKGGERGEEGEGGEGGGEKLYGKFFCANRGDDVGWLCACVLTCATSGPKPPHTLRRRCRRSSDQRQCLAPSGRREWARADRAGIRGAVAASAKWSTPQTPQTPRGAADWRGAPVARGMR